MSTVFITEKPAVAREYCIVLGIKPIGKTDGYVEGHSSLLNTNVIVTWAIGHLISIATPQAMNETWGTWDKESLPMIPSVFKYVPASDKAKQFGVVKSIYTRPDVDTIYYAGDSGREGIYIQALIRNQVFKNPPSHIKELVVWIDSLTNDEIKKGIQTAKPYSDYLNMIDSGYARAKTDWLIGMNFTKAFTVLTHTKVITGRVVTPTLALCVRRQDQIENFVKTEYYGIKANIQGGGEANWEATKDSRFFESPDIYNESGFLKIENANLLIDEFKQDMRLFIQKVETKHEKEYAPYLFNQTDLQAFCSKRFHVSPADTLAAAQRLYEAKIITYPRTSARVISTAVATELQKKGYNIPKKYINDKQIVDHHAIIPTFSGNTSSLTGLDKQVYDSILKRFMDTMKPPYEYDSITVCYRHSNKEPFFDKFKNVTALGWKAGSDDEDDEESKKPARPIPQENTAVNVTGFEVRKLETSPPPAYTTGSLVKEMEKAGKYIDDDELRAQIKSCGLGTDATRADIVKKLETTGYITVDKKQKITVTQFGKDVIKLTEKYDEQLVSPIKTADMEQHLSSIVDGEMNADEFVRSVIEYVSNTTKHIIASNPESLGAGGNGNGGNEPLGKCPKCKQDVVKGKFGFYCKGKCGMILNKVFKHELSEAQLKKLLSGKQITYTDNGKKTTVLPEVSSREWEGKTYYTWAVQKAGPSVQVSNKKHSCPCCGNDLTPDRFNWRCTNNACGFEFPYKICEHAFDESDLEYFLENGETKYCQFVSKAGKGFDAKLVLNKGAHKCEFQFPNKK